MKSSLLEIHQKLDNLQGSLNNVYQALNLLNGNTLENLNSPENLNTSEDPNAVVNCTILPGVIELVNIKYNGENLTLEPAYIYNPNSQSVGLWRGPWGDVKTFTFKPNG